MKVTKTAVIMSMLVALSIGLVGCGGSSSNDGNDQQIAGNISGRWNGQIMSESGKVNITQNGKEVTMTDEAGVSMYGEIHQSDVYFEYYTQGVTVRLELTVNDYNNPTSMNGSVYGIYSGQKIRTGSASFTKQ